MCDDCHLCHKSLEDHLFSWLFLDYFCLHLASGWSSHFWKLQRLIWGHLLTTISFYAVLNLLSRFDFAFSWEIGKCNFAKSVANSGREFPLRALPHFKGYLGKQICKNKALLFCWQQNQKRGWGNKEMNASTSGIERTRSQIGNMLRYSARLLVVLSPGMKNLSWQLWTWQHWDCLLSFFACFWVISFDS